MVLRLVSGLPLKTELGNFKHAAMLVASCGRIKDEDWSHL